MALVVAGFVEVVVVFLVVVLLVEEEGGSPFSPSLPMHLRFFWLGPFSCFSSLFPSSIRVFRVLFLVAGSLLTFSFLTLSWSGFDFGLSCVTDNRETLLVLLVEEGLFFVVHCEAEGGMGFKKSRLGRRFASLGIGMKGRVVEELPRLVAAEGGGIRGFEDIKREWILEEDWKGRWRGLFVLGEPKGEGKGEREDTFWGVKGEDRGGEGEGPDCPWRRATSRRTFHSR